MILKSFAKSESKYVPVEVEVRLVPGLPNIQIVGLPDAGIKESVVRIRSALKACGYRFPRAQTIVASLYPLDLKKSGVGVELAIAVGYLIESGQLEWPVSLNEKGFVYGALNLSGDVIVPEGAPTLSIKSDEVVVTGVAGGELPFRKYVIPNLKDFADGCFKEANHDFSWFQRPRLSDLKFKPNQARVMKVMAVGEHPALLAGPSGQGKSTLARELMSLLKRPSDDELKELVIHWRSCGHNFSWRPCVEPHHTIPAISMIGGGSSPRSGEISRAHGGTLLMDEFFEFNHRVFEALREPVEQGQIHIARGGQAKRFPARFFMLGTTNLCPCGEFVPKKGHRCRCSNRRREFYLERFKGPMLDRFAMISLSTDWDSVKGEDVGLTQILSDIERAHLFALRTRGQEAVNHWGFDTTEAHMNLEKFMPYIGSSRRRVKYLLQVARSIADLEQSEPIKLIHVEEAAEYCLFSHQRLTSQLSVY